MRMRFSEIEYFAPINEVDENKVNEIAESIKANGFIGCPILVCGESLITGSHRLTALQQLAEQEDNEEIEKALSVEAKAILKNVQGYVIALCIEGKQLGSVELSELVSELGVMGNSTISFVIGSSFGLSDEVKNKADLRLSMSKMTFPHQLARVMLLEQIYRVFQIAHGGKYHK